MYLLRTKLAVEEAEKYLNEIDDQTSPICSYLTQYIAILMCADIQQDIYKIVEEHADKNRFNVIKPFLKNASSRLLRSINKGDIKGFLCLYGTETGQYFDNVLIDKEKEISLYSSAVEARHSIAHKGNAEITFSQIKDALSVAEMIINAMKKSLDEKVK